MAGTMGVKIRDYAVATMFVAAMATGADILISNAHAPNSDACATAAKPRDVATSGLHTFAAAARQGRWSNKQ